MLTPRLQGVWSLHGRHRLRPESTRRDHLKGGTVLRTAGGPEVPADGVLAAMLWYVPCGTLGWTRTCCDGALDALGDHFLCCNKAEFFLGGTFFVLFVFFLKKKTTGTGLPQLVFLFFLYRTMCCTCVPLFKHTKKMC